MIQKIAERALFNGEKQNGRRKELSQGSNPSYKPSRTKHSNEMKDKETEESSLPLVFVLSKSD